ncbi:sulfotransferase [Pseudaminobacter soli (ex Li et al. 2025)]|uniref:sulfotransferase n=1 Tax=Pseudaminobacter soli (ex Li et al. 2025) TaxID=1295366 RepID=UPI001FE15286|nr:sulfotransferase [Mesorhizobium soli]
MAVRRQPMAVGRPRRPSQSSAISPSEPGRRYVERLRELDGMADRIVNKMLGNYVHVGMIELCLPNAVIGRYSVHLLATPRTTALGTAKCSEVKV